MECERATCAWRDARAQGAFLISRWERVGARGTSQAERAGKRLDKNGGRASRSGSAGRFISKATCRVAPEDSAS